MVDHRTRLSLDEQTSSATSLPPRSTSSLGGNFLETKQTVQDTQCNSVHKELTDPAAIAIVHAGASHHIDQFANRPTRNSASASTDLFPSSGQSTLISRSVDNLGWMESSRLNDHSGPNTLHLHPFAHTSASAALGSSLSSGLRKSSISAVSSPQFSDPSCFPSTGSFMDMGKNIKGTRSHSYQVQNAGNRRGHVGSDGIPLITYHARKRGSRFWRTLLPPFFSFLDATKPVATISASAASVRASAKLDIPSSQSCGELPPRPAPYFYPRRVDYESEEFSSEQIMPGSFCYNRGERSQMTPLPTIPKPKSFSISRKICNPQSLGSEGMEEDGISLDSNEIKSWKQRIELENPTKKFRPSLRQRFGSSLRQSVGFQQLRNACSELDVSQLARHQDECETLGPGITDDPFASHSPQLFPPLVTPISTASSISLCRQMHPSLPVPSCSSAPASDLDHPNLDVRRRSFMHMDPDCDDSSTSSFPSASDRCDPQSSPSIFYSGSGVSLSTCTQPSDQHLSQSTSVQKHLLNPNVTPSLTADTDSSSIAASSPSLSDPSEVKANNLKLDYDSDQMKLSLVPFPCLNAPDPRIFVPDVYEESAVEEGTSQDQIFVSSRSYVRSVIVESSCIGAGSISPSKKSSGVGEESVADTSDGSMDVPESLTDLTPLTAEWPLPPQHSLLNTGMARLDTENLTPRATLADHPGRVHQGLRTSVLSHPLKVVTTELLPCVMATPLEAVQVTLGTLSLKHLSFPQAISIEQSGISLVFRAISRVVLVSFCAFHAETKVGTSIVVVGDRPVQAFIKLDDSNSSQDKTDMMVVSLFQDGDESERVSSVGVNFHVSLPITLGELAIRIAKVSFASEDILRT